MKEYQFDFERLIVYQKALDLVDKIFEIYKDLSNDYKISIGTNFIRACMSIANNIAEGNGKYSKREKDRYLSTSLDSTKECVSVLNVLLRQRLINNTRHTEVRNDCREITSMLISLMK